MLPPLQDQVSEMHSLLLRDRWKHMCARERGGKNERDKEKRNKKEREREKNKKDRERERERTQQMPYLLLPRPLKYTTVALINSKMPGIWAITVHGLGV